MLASLNPLLFATDVAHIDMAIATNRQHPRARLRRSLGGADALLLAGGRSISQVISRETVAIEIIRMLVGSIGLILSVPLTTALAVVTGTTSDHGRAHGAPPPAGRGRLDLLTRRRSVHGED